MSLFTWLGGTRCIIFLSFYQIQWRIAGILSLVSCICCTFPDSYHRAITDYYFCIDAVYFSLIFLIDEMWRNSDWLEPLSHSYLKCLLLDKGLAQKRTDQLS